MKQRNYGVDLLRCVLMFFIIVGHLFAHTDIRNQVAFLSGKWLFAWVVQAVTVCSVNAFVIITGYYMSSKPYDLWKGIKLWIKVLIYSITIWIVFVLSGQVPFTVGGGLDAFFPILRNEYWFFTTYILLYLLIPFLNATIQALSKRQLKYLVVVLICVFYIEPIFSVVFYQYDETEGFGIIAFITLYFIGAFISQCEDVDKKYCIIMLFGSSSVIFLSKLILQAIVEYKNFNFGTGILYHNNTAFVLINAVALFSLFKQLNIKPIIGKMVRWCSPSVFAVYLIHEKPIVRDLIWNPSLLEYLEACATWKYLVTVFLIPMAIFASSIIVDRAIMDKIVCAICKTTLAKGLKEKCNRLSMIVK